MMLARCLAAFAMAALLSGPGQAQELKTVKIGVVNLSTDIAFKELGLVKKDLTLARVVDRTFAEAAVAQLGPYKK